MDLGKLRSVSACDSWHAVPPAYSALRLFQARHLVANVSLPGYKDLVPSSVTKHHKLHSRSTHQTTYLRFVDSNKQPTSINMKTFTIATIAALATVGTAQLSNIPQCAVCCSYYRMSSSLCTNIFGVADLLRSRSYQRRLQGSHRLQVPLREGRSARRHRHPLRSGSLLCR